MPLEFSSGKRGEACEKEAFCTQNTSELLANYANCYTVTVEICKVFTLSGPLLP